MRDFDITNGGDTRVSTAPHELGHQFGLLGDGSPLPAGLDDWGIMDGVSFNFVPQHIRVLRFRAYSPGGSGSN